MADKNKIPEVRFKGFDDELNKKKIGNITECYSGGTPLVGNKSFYGGKIAFIRSGEINSNFTKLYITDSGLQNSSAKMVEKGDILYALYGATSGEVGISNINGAINQAILAIKPIDKYNPYYLALWLRKQKESIVNTYIQGGQGNLSGSIIKDLEINIPTYIEQTKIGNYFQKLDKFISLNQQKLDKLLILKKAMLEKMFPKNGASVPEIRFKGFTGDWEEKELGEIMDVTSVKRIHQSDWTNSGIRFLRARDIVSASKNEKPSDCLYISEDKYNEYSLISGKVNINDLLVTGVGTIGIPLLITNDNPIYFKDGNIIWFKNENKVKGSFFYYSFISNNIQNHIKNSAGIGTVGTYTIDSGKKTPITLPENNEQKKIGNYFKKLDKLTTLSQQDLEKLKNIKKALLEKMFV